MKNKILEMYHGDKPTEFKNWLDFHCIGVGIKYVTEEVVAILVKKFELNYGLCEFYRHQMKAVLVLTPMLESVFPDRKLESFKASIVGLIDFLDYSKEMKSSDELVALITSMLNFFEDFVTSRLDDCADDASEVLLGDIKELRNDLNVIKRLDDDLAKLYLASAVADLYFKYFKVFSDIMTEPTSEISIALNPFIRSNPMLQTMGEIVDIFKFKVDDLLNS